MADRIAMASNAAIGTGCTMSATSYIWAWVGSNHAQIAAICALAGLVITIFGAIASYRHKKWIRAQIDNGADPSKFV